MKSITKLLISVALFLSASAGSWAQSSVPEQIKGVMVPSSRRALFVDLARYNRLPTTAVSGGDESVPLESLLDFDHVKTSNQGKTTFIQTPFRPEEEDCLGVFHEGQAGIEEAATIKKYYIQSVQGNARRDYVVTLISEKDFATENPDYDFLDNPNFMGIIFFSDLSGRLISTRTYYYGRILDAKVLKLEESRLVFIS